MAFLESSSIRVFPSARRNFQSSLSRQVTEANLVSLVNRLLDVNSFVVSNDVESGLNEFAFNIKGYCFIVNKAGDITDLFSSASNVYATIVIDGGPQEGAGNSQVASIPPEFYELIGIDNNNQYEGVFFSDYIPTISDIISNPEESYNYELYTLHILTNLNGTWSIPDSSKIKFSLRSLGISLIDGGEILTEEEQALPPED